MKKALLVALLIVSIAAFSVTIRTTGATFPQYQVQRWIKDFMAINPSIKIEYQGGGSGHGQESFLKGLTEIGRTDPPVKEATWRKFEATGDVPFQFPIVAGAVVIAYNVSGLDSLKLDGETLARIFTGDIVYWDDPAIKWLNPNAKLPHKKIIVIHRSDASGTTAIYTTYLCLVSKTFAEKVGAGKLVNWPVDSMGRGIGGKGNPGVVNALKRTKYSIAYTELSFAINENLKAVLLKNKDGNFVAPTDENIKVALASVKAFVPNPTEGYKEDLKQFLNASGKNAYPIVALTHFLVWKNVNGKHYSPAVAEAVKKFVRWVLTEGEKSSHIEVGYIGLPEEIAQIGLKVINEINVK